MRPTTILRTRRWCWVALAGLLAGAPVGAGELSLECGEVAQTRDLPLSVLVAEAPAGALLQVDEVGLDLEARRGDADAFVSLDAGPPRLALATWGVQAGTVLELRAREGRSGAQAKISLHCSPPPVLTGLPDCAGSEAGAACIALAAQAQAVEASRAGRSHQAVEAYRQAADAWLDYGDPLRSAAARLGAAQRLATLARYQEALAALPNFEDPARPRAADYWNTRVEAERCILRRRLGDAGALECARALPPRYAALDEHSEAANASLSLANMLVEDGEAEAARQQLALALASPRLSILVRGRLGVLQARVDFEDGRVPEALRAGEQALSLLEQTPDWNWQVLAQLRLAWLHLQLGASAEAERWVGLALDRLDGREAPALRAKAEYFLSRVLEQQGRGAAAVEAAAAAAQAYARAGDSGAALRARLRMQHLLPEAAALADLAVEIAALPGREDLARELALVEAEHALQAGDHERAAARLAASAASRSPYLEQRQRALTVEVGLLLANQQGERALGRIESEVGRLLGLVGEAGSAGLRHLLARRLSGLRQLWVDSYLDLPAARRPGDDAVWRLLLDTHAPRQLRGLPERAPNGLTGRALMGALGDDDPEERPSDRELAVLRRLLEGSLAPQSAPPELEQARARLSEGSVLLAWGFGQRRALMLRVDAQASQLIDLGEAPPLRKRLLALARDVRRQDSPLAELESEAQALSMQLLPPDSAPPQRLYSLMDASLPHPPLALLSWPGQSSPLLDTAELSRIEDAPPQAGPVQPPSQARVLHAAAGDGDRPRLRNAVLESELLARALPNTEIEPVALDRAVQLRSALREPAAWVHVAAHGETRRGLQGYAGVWMDAGPAAPQAEFFSWLDLQGAVRSPLVVLNACALADAGDAEVGGSASFAAALSAAGAEHVIAGQWELSDGAAALWVETLYAELAGHGEPARALKAAQQRLRSSRAYRHPFYWAGLVHLQR